MGLDNRPLQAISAILIAMKRISNPPGTSQAPMQHLTKLRRVWDSGKAVIVDTETTGTGFLSQIVSIAGLYQDGSIAFNCLVRPSVLIPRQATAVHGITNEAVADAPRWPQVVPELIDALAGREFVS